MVMENINRQCLNDGVFSMAFEQNRVIIFYGNIMMIYADLFHL